MKTAAANPTISSSPAGQRIVALDLLRGYFIIVIASIHLSYFPSVIAAVDGRGYLWTSEADGFFFISGMLIGLIRRRDLERGGLWPATKKLWQRAWILYAAGSLLSILYVLLGRLATSAGMTGVKSGLDTASNLGDVVWRILTLHYSYGWTDFLLFYAAFMLVAPAVLWLLRRGWWWLVAAVSYGLFYLHWNYTLPSAFMQWQAPFFMGVIVGYHWRDIHTWYSRRSARARQWLSRGAIWSTIGMYAAGIVTVVVPIHFESESTPVAGWPGTVVASLISVHQDPLYNRLLLDGRIGLLRPLALAVTMAGLYLLIRRYEALIIRKAGWLLLPFGRNSLYVYIVESALLFGVPLVSQQGSLLFNTSIELGMVGIVWLALRRRFLFRVIPR
jgi:hypothetical protein